MQYHTPKSATRACLIVLPFDVQTVAVGSVHWAHTSTFPLLARTPCATVGPTWVLHVTVFWAYHSFSSCPGASGSGREYRERACRQRSMTVTTDKKIDIPDEPTTPLLPVACPKEGDRPARALKIAGAATAAVTIGEEAAGSSCKCRVCLEDTTTLGNPLISPCSCTGRTGLVHRRCLLQWRATKAGSPAYFRCDICHYKYVMYCLHAIVLR